ncbi:MAG: protein kinase [Myxococcota bacterium]
MTRTVTSQPSHTHDVSPPTSSYGQPQAQDTAAPVQPMLHGLRDFGVGRRGGPSTSALASGGNVIQRVKSKIKGFDDEETESEINYDPAKQLSQGAEGTVHVGKIGKRKVIVKVAKPVGELGTQNEIGILGKVRPGPHIVGAIGHGKTAGGSSVVVLNKADHSLNNQLPKDIHRRLNLALGTGRGLQSLHDQDITHGDLNLKNILSTNGEAQLTDFGAAADFSNSDSIQLPLDPGLAAMGIQPETIHKDATKLKDRKDFRKAAVNILRGNKANDEFDGDAIDALEKSLSLKGLSKASITPIIKFARKQNPTEDDHADFVKAAHLTVERNRLMKQLEATPTGGKNKKKNKEYKAARLAIQSKLSANKKALAELS